MRATRPWPGELSSSERFVVARTRLPRTCGRFLLRHMPHAMTVKVSSYRRRGACHRDGRSRIRIGDRAVPPMIGRGHAPTPQPVDERVMFETRIQVRTCDQRRTSRCGRAETEPARVLSPVAWSFSGYSPQTLRCRRTTSLSSVFTPVRADHLPPRQQARRAVERLHAMGEACELLPALFWPRVARRGMGFGLGEVIAHLNYLREESSVFDAEAFEGVSSLRRAS